MSDIATNDPFCYKPQEEYMHQIHAKGQFGKTGNPTGCLLDTGEQQEGAKGGQEHIGRAEIRRPSQHRLVYLYARYSFMPNAPCGKQGAKYEAKRPNEQSLLLTPLQMHTNIMSQNKIPQVT